MSEERIYYLLRAYTDGSATDLEERELFQWIATTNDDVILKEHIQYLVETQADEKFANVDWEELYEAISQQAGKDKPRARVRFFRWYQISAAAAVLVFFIVTGIYLLSNKSQQPTIEPVAKVSQRFNSDIKPGGMKAILMAGNRQVILNRDDTSFTLAGSRVQIKDGGLKIVNAKPVQITLTTPRGGEFEIGLSDGTTVWLNADSKLVYPAVFTDNTRKVTLTGEAYFDVKTDAAHPFIVQSDNQQISVLGTQFNVKAYPDDQDIVTTLIIGSVQVKTKDGQMGLRPGQQALINKVGELRLNKSADIKQVVAWKNGYFRFEKADIHEIMKQLARWYNITVVYETKLPAGYFGAIISKDNNISRILELLEATGNVRFQVEGNEVRVSR